MSAESQLPLGREGTCCLAAACGLSGTGTCCVGCRCPWDECGGWAPGHSVAADAEAMTARGMRAAGATRATSATSAAGGHLDAVLRWMREHDCPCDEWTSGRVPRLRRAGTWNRDGSVIVGGGEHGGGARLTRNGGQGDSLVPHHARISVSLSRGGRATAWCLLIHAEASLSLS